MINYIQILQLLVFSFLPTKLLDLKNFKYQEIKCSPDKLGFLKFTNLLNGKLVLLNLVFKTSNFVLNLYFLYLLSTLVSSDKSQLIILSFYLGSIILIKYIFSSILLTTNILSRKKLLDYFEEKFRLSSWNKNSNVLIPRLISRDIQILLDYIPNSYLILFYPIAIIINLALIYYVIDFKGSLAFCSVILFIFLSSFIAKKSVLLANLIYDYSKNRIEIAYNFLNYRAYLNNWKETKKLEDIEKITKEELSSRNKDSFWRALDLYSIVFGRNVPIILTLILSAIINYKYNNNHLGIALWLATPLISLVMEIGRFFSDYSIAKNAYHEIMNNISFKSSNNTIIELDKNWEIWEGSLQDNILLQSSILDLNLCKELGLDKEFQNSSNLSYLETKLQFRGNNISEGQKVRILIIRAIHLAIIESKPLNISIALNSLDPYICKKLYDVLVKLKNIIILTLSTEQEQFLVNQIKRIDDYSPFNSNKDLTTSRVNEITNEEQIDKQNFIPYYLKLMPNISILFIVPAFLLSLSAYITTSGLFGLNVKIIYLSLITITAILGVSYLGAYIENKIRIKASFLHQSILKYADLRNLADIYQRISKDFILVSERISWYIHDIAWYQALMIIGLFSLTYTIGLKGIIITMFFIVILYIILKIYMPLIYLTRQQSIEGINTCINYINNLTTIKIDESNIISLKKKEWSSIGFSSLLNTNVNLNLTKSSLSNLVSNIIGFIIIIVAIFESLSNTNYSFIMFALTSLLVIESIIVNLFLAFTGLYSQIISYERLENYPTLDKKLSKNRVSIKEENNIYEIELAKNTLLNLTYNNLKLSKGVSYSLVAPSGAGKSEYLKTITNFSFDTIDIDIEQNNTKALYLDKNSPPILEWLHQANIKDFILKKITREQYNIIILDEALHELELIAAKDFILSLSHYIQTYGASIIIVDHRFELENKIFLNQLIQRGST